MRALARWWAPVVTAGLLLVLALFAAPPPVDAAAAVRFHDRAAEVQSRVPYAIGNWIGHDVPVPTSATDLLKPNVLVSRRYENMDTREAISLLIVQCTDSRDLQGHYPPVCYPAHGMELGTEVARRWSVAGHEIPAMRYTFSETDVTNRSVTVVDNFMVLPTGEFDQGMDGIRRIGKDRHLRLLGAAQVQLLTTGSMSEDRRDEVVTEITESIVPLLEPFLGKGSSR